MKSLRDGSNEYFHSNQLILSPQYQTTWGMRQFFGQHVHWIFLGTRRVQLLGKSSISVGMQLVRSITIPVYPKDLMVSFGWLPPSIDLYFGSAR